MSRRNTVLALIVSAVSAIGLAVSLIGLPIYYDLAYGTQKTIVVAPDEMSAVGSVWDDGRKVSLAMPNVGEPTGLISRRLNSGARWTKLVSAV